MVSEEVSRNDSFLDSTFRYSLFPPFYGFVFIFGLLANCYALYILRHIREAKAINEIRIYMTNLTVADLLFVMVLPLWIDYYRRGGHWQFPEFLCRVAGAMFFINTYCSVLFLTVISFNRYWIVTRPIDAATSDHWRRGVVVSVAIWVATLSASIFYLIKDGTNFDKSNNVLRCFEGYHESDLQTKHTVAVTHFLIISFFFLVFLMVVLCNILIIRALLTRPMTTQSTSVSMRGEGLKRRALAMVLLVLTLFVVCFLPHHVVQGPWTQAVLGLAMQDNKASQQFLNDAHQVTLMLMGLNCLFDPLVYCFATNMFRSYISMHFRKLRQGRTCPRKTSSTSVSMETRQPSKSSRQPTVIMP